MVIIAVHGCIQSSIHVNPNRDHVHCVQLYDNQSRCGSDVVHPVRARVRRPDRIRIDKDLSVDIVSLWYRQGPAEDVDPGDGGREDSTVAVVVVADISDRSLEN